MEITEFIRSKSIADYLKKIDYKFTPFEAAFVMYCNKFNIKRTLRERHEASEEIIVALSGGKSDKEKSLCKFLKRYMEWENKLVSEIYAEDTALYRYELYGRQSGVWHMADGSYKNFRDCIADAAEKTKEMNNKGEDEIVCISIQKECFDTTRVLRLTMTADKEIVYPHVMSGETDEDTELDWAFCPRNDLFYDIDIPMPFKKGDILFKNYGIYDGPMSETPLYTVLKEPAKGKNGVCFVVYSDGSGGTQDWTRNDFACEYYREDFSGYKRLAKAVAEYAKGKLELDELFTVRDIIKLEEQLIDRKDCLTNKGLKLIRSKRINGK